MFRNEVAKCPLFQAGKPKSGRVPFERQFTDHCFYSPEADQGGQFQALKLSTLRGPLQSWVNIPRQLTTTPRSAQRDEAILAAIFGPPSALAQSTIGGSLTMTGRDDVTKRWYSGDLRLVSRASVRCETGPWVEDRRRLGVMGGGSRCAAGCRSRRSGRIVRR